MLGHFKKSLFRALCLGVLCLGGLMAEYLRYAKALVNFGKESYDKQDFTKKPRNILKKRMFDWWGS